MFSTVSRRAFLAAAAGAVPLAARLRGQPPPRVADVIVIGGDPAAWSAVHRLAQSGLRVDLLQDAPAWRPAPPPRPATIAEMPPFVRGHQVSFDSWRDLGNPGWGYADVLPSFKRLEKYEAGESEYRGGSGPISVAHCWDPHPLHRAFLLAAISGGFQQDSRHDFNGPRSQSIAGYYQKTIADDAPQDIEATLLAAAARGVPADRVSVRPKVVVSRIVLERGRAAGVELLQGPDREVVRAERGVILAADPVRAAQLLMLSGIGPAETLKAAGLPVTVDRPGVGRNLHDQVRLPLRWPALPPALSLPESTVSVGMFTVSLAASPPDLQWDFLDPRACGGPEIGLDLTLVQPTSRGDVRLASADPQAAPTVRLDTLGTDADVTALVQAFRLARLAIASPQLDRMRGDEPASTSRAVATPDLQTAVRRMAVPRGALAGTCAMGRASDANAVVDAALAVHGVAGLHVAGASVMPVIVNAPPESASLMIGDRAADFVAATK
jgi:choline dehydrogenase